MDTLYVLIVLFAGSETAYLMPSLQACERERAVALSSYAKWSNETTGQAEARCVRVVSNKE